MHVIRAFSSAAAALTLALAVCPAPAQQVTGPAPVPAAIAQGKKVFLANGGTDAGLFPHPFSGTIDRPYVFLYNALASSGAYQLVGDPAQADLVFQISLRAPNGPQNPNKQNGASDPLPTVRLVIYDRPTHYVLWTLNEAVESANLQKTHDKNLDNAFIALMQDLATLRSSARVTGEPAPASPTAPTAP